jgi:hypothetical protein
MDDSRPPLHGARLFIPFIVFLTNVVISEQVIVKGASQDRVRLVQYLLNVKGGLIR